MIENQTARCWLLVAMRWIYGTEYPLFLNCISERPYITSSDSVVLVASGDEAILTCVAEGIPPPEIHWYKGDVEVCSLIPFF